MAKLLWGKVLFKDKFAGYLREEPGNRFIFEYDKSYLNSSHEPISISLPLRPEPFVNEAGLHPYFDNLVSEGWLASAQTRLLGKRSVGRFELLLAFGFDCLGAISVIDTEPSTISNSLLSLDDPKELSLLASRASLSGVQAKMALVKKRNKLYPTKSKEISTHIAKFPSSQFPDLIENEYLTTIAFAHFLNRENIVKLQINQVEGITEKALIIERFDRIISLESNVKEDHAKIERLHFEEFSQLLNLYSDQKYNGDYADMAKFIIGDTTCLPAELFRLYQRILAGFLLGNTDMHFKNFAMLHSATGLRLSPVYDQVCAMLYAYKNSALAIGNAKNIRMSELKAKHIVQLGHSFNLSDEIIFSLVSSLGEKRKIVKDILLTDKINNKFLKENIIKNIEKQWNTTFASIGKVLLKKR